jgi:hypothetical protein
MVETHEDCGRGHSKPIGKPCGICTAMDVGIRNLNIPPVDDENDEESP